MKKLFIILAEIIAIGFTGCGLFSNSPDYVDSNEYYVKYSISSTTYNYFSDIYYAKESGTGSAEISHSVRSWTVTIGPVKKNFKAFVRNERGTGYNKIEVSKNGGPFALKAEGTNSATYTINF
jgi:hypothetical protein